MARQAAGRTARGPATARAARRSKAGDPPIPVPLTRSAVAFKGGTFREAPWPQWLRKMPYAGLRRKLTEGGYELLSRQSRDDTFVLSRHVASNSMVAWLLIGLTATPVLLPMPIDLIQFRLAWR